MRVAIFAALISSVAAVGCEGSVRTGPAYAAEPAPAYHTGRVTTRWVTLGDRLSAHSDRQFINIGGRAGYRQIRIEAQHGAPVIKQVAIEFADDIGNPHVIHMGARLTAGEGQTIDLGSDRRPVQRIIVYTVPSFGGKYSVFGV